MILASQSPRRRELLGLITDSFTVIPSKGEENIPDGTPARTAVELLAQQKAREIAAQYSNELIIAADTVVCCDGEIMGKPRSAQHASEMLRRLSGRVHEVYTGVCVIFPEEAAGCFRKKRR